MVDVRQVEDKVGDFKKDKHNKKTQMPLDHSTKTLTEGGKWSTQVKTDKATREKGFLQLSHEKTFFSQVPG